GAGLRQPDEIAPVEHERNGLGLNRGRLGIALGVERLEQRLGQAERIEVSHVKSRSRRSEALARKNQERCDGEERRRAQIGSKPNVDGGVPGGPRSRWRIARERSLDADIERKG